MTNQPKPEVRSVPKRHDFIPQYPHVALCETCGRERYHEFHYITDKPEAIPEIEAAKPEVKGIEQFRQVERFQAYDLIDGDGVELTGVVRGSDYAALFAFTEEQQSSLKAMEEVVEAATEILRFYRKQHQVGHFAYYPCETCKKVDALLTKVGIVLGRVG